jgi:hypothetical protein
VSTYEVKIALDGGVIVCNVKDAKVKGGNVEGVSTDQVHFIGNGVQFALGFQTFPGGDTAWPFAEAVPTWPQPQFMGTLAKPPAEKTVYKYTVNVAGAPPLDPIIIVDR